MLAIIRNGYGGLAVAVTSVVAVVEALLAKQYLPMEDPLPPSPPVEILIYIH